MRSRPRRMAMQTKTMAAVIAGTALLGACMGSDPEPASTETTGPASATASRFTRSPILGPIQSTVLPRAIDPTPMTVVVFLAGPSVADLQEAAQRKLPRAEK